MNKPEYSRIADDVVLGDNVKIHGLVNLYGCTIGTDSRIGTFVEIQRGVRVGEKCKISSHSFICEGVSIGKGVFIGHSVIFTNDLFPRAITSDGKPKDSDDWTLLETIIEDYVSIGSGSVILPGIRIGRGSIIGAGSVLTKSVLPNQLWFGNPARFIRNLRNEERITIE